MNTVTATAKQEVEKLLQQLPDDTTLVDIQYHLDVLEKIKRGRADIVGGKSYTTEQARERLGRWAKELNWLDGGLDDINVGGPDMSAVIGNLPPKSLSQELHAMAEGLPLNATWLDVHEYARFRAAVEEGVAAADRGEFATDEKVSAVFAKWGVKVKG